MIMERLENILLDEKSNMQKEGDSMLLFISTLAYMKNLPGRTY